MKQLEFKNIIRIIVFNVSHLIKVNQLITNNKYIEIFLEEIKVFYNI